MRAVGADIRLPPDVDALTTEVLVAARRAPSSRVYAVEFKRGIASTGKVSNVS